MSRPRHNRKPRPPKAVPSKRKIGRYKGEVIVRSIETATEDDILHILAYAARRPFGSRAALRRNLRQIADRVPS